MLLEFLVLDESQISGQHHQSLSGVVGVLGRSVPLLPGPLLLNQEAEELVGENGRAEVPRTIVTGAVSVGTTQGVSTGESDHFTVVKSHASEDGTNVPLVLGGIWETSVRSASGKIAVLSARSPWDNRSLHLLDGAGTGKGPEIAVGDPWEFFCRQWLAIRPSARHIDDECS